MWWKQLLLTMALVITNTYAIKPQNDNLNQWHEQLNNDVLNNQTLKLAFNKGQFFSWNTNNNLKFVAGIFTTTTNQSYLLNTDGTYNNLDLQISNFIAINDKLGIATCNNYHMPNGNHYFNKSVLMNDYGAINSIVDTINTTFSKWDDKIVSTGIGADLISSNGTTSSLVDAYTYGYGTTSFSAINKDYGLFVGGDQKCYLLKSNKAIIKINDAFGQQIIAPNPNITNCFVSLNNNGGIIRDKDGQLLYLTIDSSGAIKTYALTISSSSQTLSTNINFFTAINDHQGLVNISFENSSTNFGQPYLIDVTDPMNITFTKITNHLMNNFILLNNEWGVFIDDNQYAWFLNLTTLAFNNIDSATNFQTINNDLGLLTTPTSTLLLTDKPNKKFANINSITWTKTNINQDSTFVNNYFNLSQPNVSDQTNSWITNNALTLNVTNEKLINVKINNSQPLTPNDNNITTTIFTEGSTIIIFNFSDIPSITYHVLIYRTLSLPKLDNSNKNNYQYVGISNKKLYDMNSTNSSDGFTINFKYDTTIQYVNIITMDESNMSKIEIWTIKPDTNFKLPSTKNSLTYCLETLSWNNVINLQYFTITNGSALPITEFWKSDEGINLLNGAIKFGYTKSRLFAMNASEITNLESLAITWSINEINGNIFGYIISGFLSVGAIIAIIALWYNWYLKKYFILPICKEKYN